jgi:hypothetical protein
LIYFLLLQQEEAEKKKQLLAEEKAQRLEAKANAKRRKEQEKSQKDVSKEQNKKFKELQKKEEKVKSSFRKEVLSDMKRNRHDAALQVIQCFDDEQEAVDLQLMESRYPELLTADPFLTQSETQKNDALDELFRELPTLRQSLHLNSDIDAARLIDVVSFLQSMKSLLRISSQNYSLDYFTSKILGNAVEEQVEMNEMDIAVATDSLSVQAPPPVACDDNSVIDALATTTTSDMEIVKEDHSEMTTTMTTFIATDSAAELTNTNGQQSDQPADGSEEGEAEFEDTSAPHKVIEFAQDEVELDRIQLNLIRVVLDDLHSLFGLQDRDDKKPIPHFPLNQLTWPEIARMIIIISIGKDLSKSDDEVSLL